MRNVLLLVLALASTGVMAEGFDYASIAQRHAGAELDALSVRAARMQGECLVGLKALNFKSQDKFDPVAEWSSFRSTHLLQQYPPCTVLIIMEVAQGHLRAESGDP